MKLKAVIAAITPFLATDKKPEDVLAAVLAADKKGGKDAAGSGLGARELEEKDKPNGDKGAKDKGAKDEKDETDAEDRDDDPEHTNDKDLEGEDAEVACGDPSTPGGSRAGGKTAIDSAEVDRRIAKAVAARDALHTALREVEPIVGVITADSAGKAYRAALDKLGVDTKGVHDSALPALLKVAKDKAQTSAAPVAAMDSAGVAALDKVIPGYSRLRG